MGFKDVRMNTRFSKIFLPAMVMDSSSKQLDALTPNDFCRAFRIYNDYDYDVEEIDWSRLRLRRTKVGGRKALVLDYRTREDVSGNEYTVITYSADNAQPVRCYSFFYDFYAMGPERYFLSEHNGDMTSYRLQGWPFELSWHTVIEAVRLHERHHPLTERREEEPSEV